MIIYYW